MRRVGVWGMGAVLLLALGAAVAPAAPPKVADEDEDTSAAKPASDWNPAIVKLFGLDDKKPAPKPDKDKDKDAKRDATPHGSTITPAKAAAYQRAHEEEKLRRRQDVCFRLREIARETNDEELERKAIALDQLAFEVYTQRVKDLVGSDSDAVRVGRRLPSDAAEDEGKLTAPGRRSGSQGSDDTASRREVRP